MELWRNTRIENNCGDFYFFKISKIDGAFGYGEVIRVVDCNGSKIISHNKDVKICLLKVMMEMEVSDIDEVNYYLSKCEK